MDEAAARIRLQIDSKPEDLDQIQRKLLQYKIEYESLKKDNDKKSNERFESLASLIKDLEDQFKVSNEKWNDEKQRIQKIQKLKSEIEINKNKLNILQREGQLSNAGELAYGIIPKLEKELTKLESKREESKILTKSVTSNEVAQVISKSTGIPIDKMLEGEKTKLVNMKNELSKIVIGQDEAIQKISSAILRSRAGIQDPNRPIGIFLFLGPTGVGKTELTKALSTFLFDDKNSFFRLDMSEYMEKHSVSKLIGSPPGYIGYESAGFLTEAIRRKPYQVILLDEIEKAHSDVFNLLLQVFDDGRLTDSHGRVINFKNSIIIMTSNIGAEFINFSEEQKDKVEVFTQDKILDEVKKTFKPEFVNRIDEIIIFNRITKKEIKKIIKIQISHLEKLLKNKKINIKINEDAEEWLINEGYSASYGARPLKRVIQSNITDKIAFMILNGDVKEDHLIKVITKENDLKFILK